MKIIYMGYGNRNAAEHWLAGILNLCGLARRLEVSYGLLFFYTVLLGNCIKRIAWDSWEDEWLVRLHDGEMA